MAKKNQTEPKVEEIALDVQLHKSEKYIEENWKKLAAGIAAIVVVVVAFFAYKSYSGNKEAKAQDAIASAQIALAQQQFEAALNGEGANAGFLKIIKEYSGTKTANLAKLYAAICYAQTDKIDDAIKMFEDYSTQSDQIISPSATACLANCYVSKGQNEKGIELLLKAAKQADNDAVSPNCLLQAGEIYEAIGKNDEAVKLYEQIKKEYFRSQISQDIDKYIERATK